ncbi:hypothetical protein D3C71_912620 [compost metagenome]
MVLGRGLLIRRILQLAELDLDGLLLAITQDHHIDVLADRAFRHDPQKVAHLVNILAVEFQHDIAGLDRAIFHRSALGDAGDKRTLGAIHAEACRHIVGDGLDTNTEPAAARLTEFDELLDDILGKLRRHGESDTDRTAARRNDRRIDADHLALHVEERTAGIALVDGRIRLDEIVIGAGIDITPARGNNTDRQRSAKPEGIADGHHPVADAHAARITELDGLQRRFRLHLQDGKIGFRIGANQRRLELRTVRENHLDGVGTLDDVVVGDDVTGRVDHETGPQRIDLFTAFRLLAVEIILEEFLEGRTLRQFRRNRALAVGLDVLRGGNIHHRVEKRLSKISHRFRPMALRQCRNRCRKATRHKRDARDCGDAAAKRRKKGHGHKRPRVSNSPALHISAKHKAE